jgi:hypothetical protein
VVFKAVQYRILPLSVTGTRPPIRTIYLSILQKRLLISIATETPVLFFTSHKRVDNGFGGDYYKETGEIMLDSAIEEFKVFDAVYLGAIGQPDIEPGILKSLSAGKMVTLLRRSVI